MTESNLLPPLLDAFERPILSGAVVVYATTSGRAAIVKYGIVREVLPPRTTPARSKYSSDVDHDWEVVVDGISSDMLFIWHEDKDQDRKPPSDAMGITEQQDRWSHTYSYLILKPRTLTRLDNLVVIPGVDREYISSHAERFKEWGHRTEQLKELKKNATNN